MSWLSKRKFRVGRVRDGESYRRVDFHEDFMFFHEPGCMQTGACPCAQRVGVPEPEEGDHTVHCKKRQLYVGDGCGCGVLPEGTRYAPKGIVDSEPIAAVAR